MLTQGISSAARVIAFYLPQFHPIPENDLSWGKGFTEWTNVTKAKPLFPDHYQPQLPEELGFYDLRLPETRDAQAHLARTHGIEAFCYWHYWFAGERLLERPFQEVLESGSPDLPFCLGWANHTWSGLWSGGDERRIIKEQTYPGRDDHRRHFEYLLSAFRDPRYVRVEGKPLFVIYCPLELPDCRSVLEYWRQLAHEAGLPGLHLVATLNFHERAWDAAAAGFDAATVWTLGRVTKEALPMMTKAQLGRQARKIRPRAVFRYVAEALCRLEHIYDYSKIRHLLRFKGTLSVPLHPMAIPNWDTTARYGEKATVFHNAKPEDFRIHLREVIEQVQGDPEERRIIFLKSWNEWAEGNYVEPDRRFGRGYLNVLKSELMRAEQVVNASEVEYASETPSSV